MHVFGDFNGIHNTLGILTFKMHLLPNFLFGIRHLCVDDKSPIIQII